MSGRSSPAVSMRSPTMSARAVRRVGAVTGEISVMASVYGGACAIASRLNGAADREGCSTGLFHDRLEGTWRCGPWTIASDARWRLDGVRVVRSNELDINTAQTPGMNRAAAITHARAGAEKLWAGTVVIHPKAKTGAHHHGPVESVIYVVSGRARMRWGDRLEFVAEAGPGDFIYVPPFVPHQEINASDESRCPASWCAAARSRWWSISICRMSSRIRRRSSGSTTFIRRGAGDLPPQDRMRLTAPASRRARAPGSDAPPAENPHRDRR